MKIIFLGSLLTMSLWAQTKMSKQATYPNTGSTDARKDVVGQGISNATEMSDSKSQGSSDQMEQKQEQEETPVIQTGPYKDGVYQYKKRED